MSMKPLKANFVYGKLEVVDNPHTDGDSTASSIEFVFNPSKLVVTAQAKWEQPTQGGAKKASVPTYKGAEPRSMDVEFILDGWDLSGPSRTNERKVDKDIATLVSWTRPTKSTRSSTKPRPPTVELKWGPKWFPAYVASVNSTITMFDDKGFPLRATVKVTLKELPSEQKGPNPTSGTRVGHQSHTLVAGETLPALAQRYYDKPAYWRGLAAVNDIHDPTRLRAGTRVYLPPITDVAEASK